LRIQEIYFQDMDLAIKLKSLMPDEVDTIQEKYSSASKVEYMMIVLNTCVYNLRSDIMSILSGMDKPTADQFIKEIYNGCVMLNPGLDINTWVRLTQSYDTILEKSMIPEFVSQLSHRELVPLIRRDTEYLEEFEDKPAPKTRAKPKPTFKIPRAKFLNLHKHLSEKVIGQPEAIDQIFKSLKRSQVGLKDADRPIAVFLLTGPSGTGKTYLAKELHSYLFGPKTELVRIDCGEFQQKHENQKLIGSSSGYVGYEDGGQLTDAIRKNPQTVLLLDEVEKAHPDLWGTFLNVFDDGYLVDNKGEKVSFKEVIIILTSNLGNDKIANETFSKGTGFAASIDSQYDSKKSPKRTFVEEKTKEAIYKYFKPELINRLDDIIIFNYLTDDDYEKIAELEFDYIAEKMSKLNFNINWSAEATDLLVQLSGKSLEGARSMAKIRRSYLEDPLADLLLDSKYRRGTTFNIDVHDGEFTITDNAIKTGEQKCQQE
jgi:ATP-dependent Clp protease ATP-binding subunit ClpA